MLRFILYAIIFFLLVRFIGKLFLPQPDKKQSNMHAFYQIFKNVRNPQDDQQQKQNGDVNNRLDDIEEAEYEDVTDEKTESSN